MTNIQGFVACDHEARPLDDETIRRMHSVLSMRESFGMGNIAEAIFSLLCIFRWWGTYNDPESCCVGCTSNVETAWEADDGPWLGNDKTMWLLRAQCALMGCKQYLSLERCDVRDEGMSRT